ncbi:MAG: glycosyltransferase family 4 protein [Peptococcaceae bacterium]|nr:glycosyltransferase family 4 protein [Peptococcaceae bacterium]
MRILVISHMYPSSVNPVYGIFVHKQVKALQEQGCSVKVISPVPYAPWPLPLLKKKWRDYASIPSQAVVDGVEVYYPRYLEFPRSFLLQHSGRLMYLGLRRLVRRLSRDFKFDLIHAHVALPDGHAAFLLKKAYNLPVIVTVHGVDFLSTIHKGDKIKQKLFAILEGADRIITVSSKLKRIIADRPFAAKTVVINNGINPEDCGPGQSGKTQARRVLSVSNLKKTKGLDINMRAIAQLADKYPDLMYYVVGDGEERQNLEKLAAELNIKDRVVFMGRLDHPATMKQMAEADIFCLPSWQEGFGIVYIEAMAQGLPTIAVRGEGIEDVIAHDQNGLLVRPHCVKDVVTALDLLLSDPAKALSLGQAGRQTVMNGFTWKHNAEKTLKLYEEVLSK